MRKSKVRNKYNLTPKSITKLKVNRAKLGEKPFWRNNVIDAWCLTGSTVKNSKDSEYGTYNSFWLGVYDEDAKSYAGKIRVTFDSYGGMCSYNFKKFFDYKDIENEMDLEIQEKFIEVMNQLIDEGVFEIV